MAGPADAWGSHRLEDYGLIGNLHTAALVSRFGSIDWACLPRFASPSVFGRILDWEKGGYHGVSARGAIDHDQSYLPSSNVLRTRLSLTHGRSLLVDDFMPITPGSEEDYSDAMIVRVLRAHQGPVKVEVAFQPRFRYGRHPARFEYSGTDWTADGSGDTIRYDCELPTRQVDGSLVSTGSVVPGRPVAVRMGWGRRWPNRKGPIRLLNETSRFWESWVQGAEASDHAIHGPWHDWIVRTELVLKLLTSAKTGAIIAAPTTSLPEWPGGSRNWDYRYVWIRDAAFSAQALIGLGHEPEARAFVAWALDRIGSRSRPGLRVVYGADGETALPERELPHLRGFLDSRPVRIGNRASQQFQLDIYGELLDAAWLLSQVDTRFLEDRWPSLALVAEDVLRKWKRPDHGIWEMRNQRAHHVHSKLMAWVALDRAAKLAFQYGNRERGRSWAGAAIAVGEEILRRGFDSKKGSFVQSFERRVPDAANLRIPLVRFLPFDDPRVVGTVETVQRELSLGPFVYRYREPDGVGGNEGAFLPCSFWLVECLAGMGRRKEALQRWNALLEIASPLRLFSEELDPRSRRMLGNYPQALTHIAMLRAAVALGRMTQLGS